MNNKKGRFFVIEGIDGSGKSTLTEMLKLKTAEHNLPFFFTREPTDDYIGKIIREILYRKRTADEKTIAALFLADRLEHILEPKQGMKQYIEQGTNVWTDRYYLSSYAYHSSYVSLDWVIQSNSLCRKLLKPDIIFYIDISVAESLKRLQKGRASLDQFETEQRITQVKENYETAIAKVRDVENIIRINGEQEAEKVFEKIWSQIKKAL